MQDLGMTPPTTEKEADSADEFAPLNVLTVLVNHLRLLVWGSIVIALMALGISFLLTPTFTAEAKFLPPQQQQSVGASMLQSLGSLSGLAGAAGLKNPSDQYIALLKSRSVRNVLIDRFGLMERYEVKYRTDARKGLEKRTRVTSAKDGLITIEFDDRDPKVAADIGNAYIEELGHLLNRLAVTEAQQRRVFFGKQLEGAKDNLIKAEQALAATGVSVGSLNSNPATALEAPARLRAQVTVAETKLSSLRSYLAPSAGEYRAAEAELATLRRQLAASETTQQPVTGANDYIAKYREFKYSESLYELFTRQFELAKVDESREGALIQIVDPAAPPELKSKPVKSLITLIALLGSAFLLSLFVLVRDALRRRLAGPAAQAQVVNLRTGLARFFGKGRAA